jgi:hypothetical protein
MLRRESSMALHRRAVDAVPLCRSAEATRTLQALHS